MNFHDIRMPKFIEVFAVGAFEFSTSHASTKSGREVRKLNHNYANYKYLIKDAYLNYEEFEQFNSFFKARRGSNFTFRFRDYADHKVVNGFIARGGNGLKQFHLSKSYDDSILPYSRIITKPVENTVNLYINNVNTTYYSIDLIQGTVTLPNILTEDQILTADFIFDLEVRFKNDSFEYTYCNDSSIKLANIELLEVKS